MHSTSSNSPFSDSTSSISPSQRRLQCQQCLRPQRTCICKWVTSIASKIELLILQHPLEVANAKGTARLLHLCLPNSQLIIGEQFDESTLQNWLTMPLAANRYAHNIGGIADISDHSDILETYPILLYPQTEWQSEDWDEARINKKNEVNSAVANDINKLVSTTLGAIPEQKRRYRLIVLDGTWRKSRKMLARNPLLQRLPRLALHNPPTSHYTIRKAHRLDQLSTFEASCLGLMQLENDIAKYQPLLSAFEGFISQQQSYVSAGRDSKSES